MYQLDQKFSLKPSLPSSRNGIRLHLRSSHICAEINCQTATRCLIDMLPLPTLLCSLWELALWVPLLEYCQRHAIPSERLQNWNHFSIKASINGHSSTYHVNSHFFIQFEVWCIASTCLSTYLVTSLGCETTRNCVVIRKWSAKSRKWSEKNFFLFGALKKWNEKKFLIPDNVFCLYGDWSINLRLCAVYRWKASKSLPMLSRSSFRKQFSFRSDVYNIVLGKIDLLRKICIRCFSDSMEHFSFPRAARNHRAMKFYIHFFLAESLKSLKCFLNMFWSSFKIVIKNQTFA